MAEPIQFRDHKPRPKPTQFGFKLRAQGEIDALNAAKLTRDDTAPPFSDDVQRDSGMPSDSAP